MCGHFCHHVLALQDAQLHVGTGRLPTGPCSLPAFRVVPLTITGLLSCKLAFVTAKALEANSNANPNTRLFDTVANFMTAPFSSPNLVGERLGRPGSRLARENPCVLPRIAYNAAVGVQPISSATSRWACRAVHGGFLTWAAKPSVRESPEPRKNLSLDQSRQTSTSACTACLLSAVLNGTEKFRTHYESARSTFSTNFALFS